MSPANTIINLTAVIVAVTNEQPRVLIVDRDGPGLPSGPFDPAQHDSLESGLRQLVEAQTGLGLYYVEQLYTFGNRNRDPLEAKGGPRVVSVAYLALTHEDHVDTENAEWRDWYSFLPWEYFEQVQSDDITLPYEALTDYWPENTTKPKAYVPFAVPMRLTNNARCLADSVDDIADPEDAADDLYCSNLAADYGLTLQCVDTVDIALGQSGQLQPICVSDTGVPNVANTAATRARLSLQPRYDEEDNVVGAWAVVITEEDKGLGSFGFKTGENGEEFCDPDVDDECETLDIGKNIWYHSFDMGSVNTSDGIGVETSLVSNLVSQGNLLNQPEVYWETGEFYGLMQTLDMVQAD